MAKSSNSTISYVQQATQLASLFSHPLAMKLGASNFLRWRQLVMAAIKGNHMEDFILGFVSSPPEYLNDIEKAVGKVNDAYLFWHRT